MKLITRIVSHFAIVIAFTFTNAKVFADESAWIVQLKPSVETMQVKEQLGVLVGRDLKLSNQYSKIMNGFSTSLSYDEVLLLRSHSSVLSVVEDVQFEIHAFASEAERLIVNPESIPSPVNQHTGELSGAPVVDLIRANEIWNGAATNDDGSFGEGIVIGVVGTGISGSHPAFAATGDDGFTHTNPLGDGVYLGECFQSPELECNSKLIGRYTFSNDPLLSSEQPDGASNRVAGQAAGNRLSGETVSSIGVPLVSGVAPHANLIVYRVCETNSCSASNVLQAFEQAIDDEVDVLAHFVGSPPGSPWASVYAPASLALRSSGISLAYITGNSGPTPGSLNLNFASPWVATFTSSTHGRGNNLKVLTDFSGGDTPPPEDLVGGSMGGTITAGIVYAGNLDVPNANAALCLEPFAPGTLNGEILVCDRGQISRVQKALNALDSGAGGFVLANVAGGSDSVESDVIPIPGIHLNTADSNQLRDWLGSGTGHMATIALNDAPIDPELADQLSAGSSRGPLQGLDYLVPSVAVPSVNVISPEGVDQFLVVNGVAAGAGAGAMALLKAVRPDWNEAELLSALMTTGIAPLVEQGSSEPTSAFDHGGGRIDVAAAAQTGLVLNETAQGFLAANPDQGGTPSRMNLAGLVNLNCLQECEWTRTLKAVTPGTWSVSVESESDAIDISITPSEFSLNAGEEQVVQVTFNLQNGGDGTYEGSVFFVSNAPGTSTTRLTVSVNVLGDADFDGVANTLDNCLTEINPDQRDSDLDGFGNICDTDLTNNGVTNFEDLAQFAQSFQTIDENADFNGDGKVDFVDLELLRAFFLQPPGPSGTVP